MDQDTHYEAIEHLAYQLWLERGSPIGSPDEDWFHAERVLHGDRIDEIPANTPPAAKTGRSHNFWALRGCNREFVIGTADFLVNEITV